MVPGSSQMFLFCSHLPQSQRAAEGLWMSVDGLMLLLPLIERPHGLLLPLLHDVELPAVPSRGGTV
jgi:hypothetical protein